jgi:hypothetical protein
VSAAGVSAATVEIGCAAPLETQADVDLRHRRTTIKWKNKSTNHVEMAPTPNRK